MEIYCFLFNCKGGGPEIFFGPPPLRYWFDPTLNSNMVYNWYLYPRENSVGNNINGLNRIRFHERNGSLIKLGNNNRKFKKMLRIYISYKISSKGFIHISWTYCPIFFIEKFKVFFWANFKIKLIWILIKYHFEILERPKENVLLMSSTMVLLWLTGKINLFIY